MSRIVANFWHLRLLASVMGIGFEQLCIADNTNFSMGMLIAMQTRTDVLMADFEGGSYDGWMVKGIAFGNSPTRGELSGQGPPSGYCGKGYANSFVGGIVATGLLQSASFHIERHYLNFLIGGGQNSSALGVRLLINGETVASQTGPNDTTGKMQRLDWKSWDVSTWIGQTAVIEIFDTATSGAAHIMADQFIQSDADYTHMGVSREFQISKEWLSIPVKAGSRYALFRLMDGDKLLREFEVELADGTPDFWAYEHVGEFAGRELRLERDWQERGASGMSAIAQVDEWPDAAQIYHEKYRPEYHFTARRGRILDPNGLVYYKGQYHLFFQHFSYGLARTAIRSWGHAVSSDLVYWTERPDAVYTDENGTIYSGCGVVDERNSAGLASGEDKTIACFYTSASGMNPSSMGKKVSQSMVYSVDGGVTWIKHPNNPVIPNIYGGNRDPKVIWHEPTQSWIMALFMKDDGTYTLLRSSNLINWTSLSDIVLPGVKENPDIFELPVDGNTNDTKWVFSANGNYYVGNFDGRAFTPEGSMLSSPWDGTYAESSFSQAPYDDRRIQLAYLQGAKFTTGMPFITQMTVPRELTLIRTGTGTVVPRIMPARELETLRGSLTEKTDCALSETDNPLSGVGGETLDLELKLDPGSAQKIALIVQGQRVEYDVNTATLNLGANSAPYPETDRPLNLRILIDRTSIEIFGANGLLQMSCCFVANPAQPGFKLKAEGGTAQIISLKAWPMASIWQ